MKLARLMKYLSGGEYEKEKLTVVQGFKMFLQSIYYGNGNVTIFDEPGTAMSTASLQEFIDGLPADRCTLSLHTSLSNVR